MTPVKVEVLAKLLEESKYNPKETQFLCQGFAHGFSIGYQGPTKRQSTSCNLPLRVGNPIVLWNKIMKEVHLGRVAGPYYRIPFESFIQSPIGLVPKQAKNQTRLIFHLSYVFADGTSVNGGTPKELCSVKYRDLDCVIKLCLQAKGNKSELIYLGKADALSAFRVLPLSRASWRWLIMKACNPETFRWQFFVDKCLPFGASISCSHYQRFSDALRYLRSLEQEFTMPSPIIWMIFSS